MLDIHSHLSRLRWSITSPPLIASSIRVLSDYSWNANEVISDVVLFWYSSRMNGKVYGVATKYDTSHSSPSLLQGTEPDVTLS